MLLSCILNPVAVSFHGIQCGYVGCTWHNLGNTSELFSVDVQNVLPMVLQRTKIYNNIVFVVYLLEKVDRGIATSFFPFNMF